MKRILNIGLITLFLIVFACDPGTEGNSEVNDFIVVEVKTTSKQTVNVYDGTKEELPIVGTSTLHRNANGITANFKAEGLMPGHTFTVWWVIWNAPENCQGPCDEDPEDDILDLFNPATKAEVLYAGGNVAGNNGKVHISAHLNEGDDNGSVNELFELPDVEGGALIDALTAEVHLVLRSHGPKIPGLVNEQISSYVGGCDDPFAFPPFSEVPDEVGECGDIYFSVHIAE